MRGGAAEALALLADALDDGEIGWREAVWAAVRLVPWGRVVGYGDVAAFLARPRRARQVGFALAALEPGTDVPWWRVVRSSGDIALRGDPTRGPLQAARLRAEGVEVRDWRVVRWRVLRWRPDG